MRGSRIQFDKIGADADPGPFERLEARLVVEASAAATATKRATSYDLAFPEDRIARMEHEAQALLLNEKGDRDVHPAAARMTGNAIIVSMGALWVQRDQSLMWKTLHEHIHAPTVRPLWIGDHHAVLTALRLRTRKRPTRPWHAISATS